MGAERLHDAMTWAWDHHDGQVLHAARLVDEPADTLGLEGDDVPAVAHELGRGGDAGGAEAHDGDVEEEGALPLIIAGPRRCS
jgi:hypothetical protein